MSTLRINNIEAQSVPASPTIDEKVKVTNSSGDILVNIDGKTSGITTIGINTTDGNIKFDANSNVLITGILTATTLAGNFTPDSLEIGSNIKLGNAGVITATNFKSGVTNVHNLGITLTGGQLDVGSNIKLGNAGVVTAAYYVGSGAASLSPSGGADELVIGASNGSRGITIFGATSNIFFGDSGDNDVGQIQYEHSDNSMRINTNAAERLRILSNGAVGIGTNNFSSQLNNEVGLAIHGSSNDNCRISITTPTKSNSRIGYFGLSNMFGVDVHNGLEIRDAEASYATRLRIDSSGRVLIGTTTEGHAAADNLTVADTGNSGITIRSGSSNNGAIYFSDGTSGSAEYKGAVRYIHSDNALGFYTNGSENVRIASSGSVRLLDFSTAVDSGADDFVVGTTNSGINRGMTILSHTGADARICFATASDPDEGMIKYSHGSDMLQFFVDAAERMRIENLGDAEYGMKFLNSKAIEFKDQAINICSLTWSINAATWTNFFSHQSYFQGWVFLNGTHNAGNSSALWSISKSPSGGSTANRFAHDNSYSPASVNMRVNGLWTQINTSYATYGYAVLISLAGGNNVANLSG